MHITEQDRIKQFHETIKLRISELRRKYPRASRRFRHRIAPRWSCGSPADLSEGYVAQLALDEVRCHFFAMEGFYGDEAKTRADADGALKGIAVVYWEEKCHWHRFDLLTGEDYLTPFTGVRRCKHTRISVDEYARRYREAIQAGDRDAIKRLDEGKLDLLGKSSSR